MNPDPMKREDTQRKIALDRMLREAVYVLIESDHTGAAYEQGVTQLVAVCFFDGNWQQAQTAIGDKKEEMLSSAVDQVDRTEKSHNRAASELVEAKETLARLKGEKNAV